ncbi:hypothetical protein [Flavobacterium akiainvivens]|uniref:hypothetical protein n=1 Tax=Flavobacterium akiainvivens TaxID=1202724 RepID=UPI0006C893D3|nr:hypothetical protein [Flavobacterium akiainvivens]SFQ43068.1 hypothetical protein SAMN05444144_104222 [Flavobacterium akiainvivens]
MKSRFLPLAALSLLLTVACTEKKQGEVPESEVPATEEVDATATATDSLPPAEKPQDTRPAEGDIITITGEVFEINQGKDGYSAKLKNTEGKTYIATISIPNMADPKDYRAVKTGDKITVTGEVFPIEEDIMIKVTKLH